jgi:hypothetical protein
MDESSRVYGLPEDYDIEEIQNPAPETDDTIQAGEVDLWIRLQPAHLAKEKSKIRTHITYTFLLIWILWIGSGLIRLFVLGDTFLFIPFPLLLIPLHGIVKFYFT